MKQVFALRVLVVVLLISSYFLNDARAQPGPPSILDCHRIGARPGPGPRIYLCLARVHCQAPGFPASNQCNNGVYGDLWVIPKTRPQIYLRGGSCNRVVQGGTQSHDITCLPVGGTSFYCDYWASGPYTGGRASVEGYCYQTGSTGKP